MNPRLRFTLVEQAIEVMTQLFRELGQYTAPASAREPVGIDVNGAVAGRIDLSPPCCCWHGGRWNQLYRRQGAEIT